MTRRLSTLLVAASLAWATPALAQPAADPTREANERFRRGVELTDAGDYQAALVEFRRAWELGHNPAVLFNLSATQEAAGRYAEALDSLREFRGLAPAGVVATRRTELEAAEARLLSRVGTVVVAIDTPGLRVRLDGAPRDAAEARAGLRVNVGTHRVALEAPGFVSREDVREVAGESTVVLREPLAPVRSTLRVETDVRGAEVLVDGHVVATTPMQSPWPVDEGRHRVEVRRPGYAPLSTEVDAHGQGAVVTAPLAWASPVPADVAARLVVRASEDHVEAALDGHPLAPDGSIAAPPGEHRLRVARGDFVTVERDVVLRPGASATVDVMLTPTAAVREARASRARTAHALGSAAVGAGGAALVAGAVIAGLTWGPYLEHRDGFARVDEEIARTCLAGCEQAQQGALYASRDAWDALVKGDNTALIAAGVTAGAGLAAVITGAIVLATAPGDRPGRWPPLTLRPGFGSLALDWRF